MKWWKSIASKRTYALVAVLTLGVAAAIAGTVYWRTAKALRRAEQAVIEEGDLKFVSRPLTSPVDAGFEWLNAPAAFTQAAEFAGHLYVAGPAGLLEYGADGQVTREFRVGRELPAAPLVRVAPAVLADSRQPELVI